MRYLIFTATGFSLGAADTAQASGDVACNHLAANPAEVFAYTQDTAAGYVYPFTRFERMQSPRGYSGRQFKTLRQCLANDDGRGYHVETWGGGRFTAVAWFALHHEAAAERNRRTIAGQWHGMPPRVVAGTSERG